jgi:DNA-binding response OmpR family regulator
MGRILIADDDEDVRELIAFKLELEGHEVRTVGDGVLASNSMVEFEPDLAVLDVMMPRRSGLELCGDLRASVGTDRLPIILLTAKARESDIEAGFAAGADDYLVKPFSPRELASRVRAVLARANFEARAP